MAKSIVDMKAQAYEISKKMGNMQQEFNQLNEQLKELEGKIAEAEKQPVKE